MKKHRILTRTGIFILILFFLFRFFGCRGDRSKAEHLPTIKVCDGRLYVETYMIFNSGAFGGDRVSEYLTDSVSFRMYVETFDDAQERIAYQCKGDSICVYRKQIIDSTNSFKLTSTRPLSVLDLKKKKVFE